MEGALTALQFVRLGYDWSAHAEMPGKIVSAMSDEIPSLMTSQSSAVRQQLIEFLGTLKSDQARSLLWQFADDPRQRDQALICLGWVADPKDLPVLGAMLLDDKPGMSSLPYILRKAYGDRAIPYLLKAMNGTPIIQLECAKELFQANQVEGYRYFAQAIRGHSPFREAALARLQDLTRTLPQHDDATILRYLDEKIKAFGG